MEDDADYCGNYTINQLIADLQRIKSKDKDFGEYLVLQFLSQGYEEGKEFYLAQDGILVWREIDNG